MKYAKRPTTKAGKITPMTAKTVLMFRPRARPQFNADVATEQPAIRASLQLL
jgi:hypothetical protein